MFSHVFVSVTDFDRALAFHGAVMRSLGIEQRFVERDKPWAGWHSAGGQRPLFVICRPFDGQPHDPGNGQMVAFMAPTRQKVHEAYETALAHGGRCEGPPGPRPHYHAHYYGAYFRDPDGNKFCVACHAPEGSAG
jgi:lactoylglutathione lyase